MLSYICLRYAHLNFNPLLELIHLLGQHQPNFGKCLLPYFTPSCSMAFGLCEPSPGGAVRPQVGAGRPMVGRPRWGREARGGDSSGRREVPGPRGRPRGGVPGATVSPTILCCGD